ncbi:LuxR C-terminal-related transcriptional regulator [Streptomyces sp. TR06-5]|uniref:response regulator transcription factor n=1 Tax=unclassified Streptomyces TaxID=2593676 RepID=UPI0039A20D4B
MQRIRVLVVDDHRIFADALAAALTAEEDVEATAVGSAAAAVRALRTGAAEGQRPEVLLADADLGGAEPAPSAAIPAPRAGQDTAAAVLGHLDEPVVAGASPRADAAASDDTPAQDPSWDGIALVAALRREFPALRAVVLAERDDAARASAALRAGACGWVAKDCGLSRLLDVVRGVVKGETHVPPLLLTEVLDELTASRSRSESEQLVQSLTPRELEVLRCMVAGWGRGAVAERLFLSPHTVRTHMQNVLGKLGVHSTLAAVALARRAGVPPAGVAGEAHGPR